MIKKPLVLLLKFYKSYISIVLTYLFGHACRYELSCSEYAIKTIDELGVYKGGLKSIRRFASCNPYVKPMKGSITL